MRIALMLQQEVIFTIIVVQQSMRMISMLQQELILSIVQGTLKTTTTQQSMRIALMLQQIPF